MRQKDTILSNDPTSKALISCINELGSQLGSQVTKLVGAVARLESSADIYRESVNDLKEHVNHMGTSVRKMESKIHESPCDHLVKFERNFDKQINICEKRLKEEKSEKEDEIKDRNKKQWDVLLIIFKAAAVLGAGILIGKY